LLAQHCSEAGHAESAVAYWLKAGLKALARSATTEAVVQLRKGLEVLADQPESQWRWQQELELQIALRPALTATKGQSATEAGETLVRARALVEQINRPEYLVPISLGQWAFHHARGDHGLTLTLAEQIEKIGETRNDPAVLLQGRRLQGMSYWLLGEFVASRAVLERCLCFSDPVYRDIGAGVSDDPYSIMLVQLATTLAFLGYIDQARSRLNEALWEARKLRHAVTLNIVLVYAFLMASMIGSPELQRQFADELLTLTTEHGFSVWSSVATAYYGWSLTSLGQLEKGLAMQAQGLRASRAAGRIASSPHMLAGLARAYAALGQLPEGLNALAEAEQIIAATQERYHEAEVHRLRGDLVGASGDRSGADWHYHQAIAVAERQSAKLLQLKASVSLARLWHDQGKRTEARDLLDPIYKWFTEGFEAPDLRDAKTLLEQLTS
jgi:tetratricopeptide (TPR) repeat protein